MATIVFTDAYVMINSVELSDHVKSVTLNGGEPIHSQFNSLLEHLEP